jgi:predicted dinucleotide-binding enzyme
MTNIIVVIGIGSIGQAIARRVSAGKQGRDERYAARAPTPSITCSQSSTFRSCGATRRC